MKGHLLKALVLLLTLTSTVAAQFNFEFTGGGVRAEGMGKAYLALSDDVHGGSWNPAGLYAIEKPVLGISWGSLTPRGASTGLYVSQLLRADHSGSYSDLTAIDFAAPFRIKGHPVVGSFSWTRNCDVFESWAAHALFDMAFVIDADEFLTYDTGLADQRIDVLTQGGLNSANIAFASRLYGNSSFGVSANIYSGSALQERSVLSAIENFPVPDDPNQRAFAVIEEIAIDTNKFSGTNFTIGFKYANATYSTGLSIRTPFTMRIEWDEAYYTITTLNSLVEDDLTDTVYVMDQLMEYDIPWIIGAGFAYNVKENWLVAADAELATYGGGKIRYRTSVLINPGGDNIEEFIEIDPQWEDVLALRLGTEYLLGTRAGTVPLRMGLGMTPSATPNYDALGNTSKATTYSASLGTGIHWEQIRLDVAYSVSTIDRQYYGLYDYTNRNHHLNFGFTGVF